MHASDFESDYDSDSDDDTTERFWEGWSEYQNIFGFQYMEHNEFEDVTYKRFFCRRSIYTVILLNENQSPERYLSGDWERCINSIGHHTEELWSTYWLDIVFNSKLGQRKDIMRHNIFIDEPLPHLQESERPCKAYPSNYFIGYYHFLGDWKTVYFLCSIACIYEPTIKRSYMVPLTEKERNRLLKRIQVNRRYSTTKWLMEQWT